DALAAKLGFEATEDDVKAEFERANVEDVEKSMKEFTESGQMPAIRESIRRSKAVQWLVENAEVTEVDEVAERRAATDAAAEAVADAVADAEETDSEDAE
ncbi:MAG: trigger factor, partial [Atopobiaceae bacterium]|nr:trigger factor [Atopobiaceae bacterium]